MAADVVTDVASALAAAVTLVTTSDRFIDLIHSAMRRNFIDDPLMQRGG